ncbi:hypothetical protein Droror1_Dr00017434 [Drosera rotundifolia]
MAKHHPDLIMCRKQPGIAIGRLCEKCDGKCVICDSNVRPCMLVRVCDECNYLGCTRTFVVQFMFNLTDSYVRLSSKSFMRVSRCIDSCEFKFCFRSLLSIKKLLSFLAL